LYFRRHLKKWWQTPNGIVLARDPKRLLQALTKWQKHHTIVFEAHALNSLLFPKQNWLQMERQVIQQCDGLITNCGGTLKLWQQQHGEILPTQQIIHNGTAPDRCQKWQPQHAVRYIGSLKDWKGIDILEQITHPIELIGARNTENNTFANRYITVLPAISYTKIPTLLASSRVLLLLLRNNLFGRSLTSPLKLWDYLASGAPIVAPDLPSVTEIATLSQSKFFLYTPDNPQSLSQAITQAYTAKPREPFVRTWLKRAQEVEQFIQRLR